MLKASEHEQLLILNFRYLGEDVVTRLNGVSHRVTTYITIVMGITVLVFVVRPVSLVIGRDLVGIAEVRIVYITSHNPVPTVQHEVECHNAQGTSHVVVFTAWCA